MTWQSETRAWVVASAAAFCLSAIGYRVITAPKLPDLTPTLARANTALDTVNHPCAPGPCGTLANVDKLVVKVGDIAVDTQRQVQQSGTLINAASQSLTSTAEHLNAAVDTANAQMTHIGPMLDAGKDAAGQFAGGWVDLTGEADGAVGDFRHFLTAPGLTGTINNVSDLTAQWAAISADGRKVTDKMTADYFKPVPWYMVPVKRSGEILDVGAAIARHAP